HKGKSALFGRSVFAAASVAFPPVVAAEAGTASADAHRNQQVRGREGGVRLG
ncbi:Hypothetical predicted protein, partial [Marmota monax]